MEKTVWQTSRNDDRQGRYHRRKPVIDCPSCVKRGESFEIAVDIDQILNNQTDEELQVRWVTLYFYPDGNASPYKLQTILLDSNNIGIDETGGNLHLSVRANCSVNCSGTLFSIAFCNVQEFFYSCKRLLVE